jgi:hypothetical protein
MISPIELENCFLSWVNGVFEKTNRQIVTIDGKKLRRSHDRSKDRNIKQMEMAKLLGVKQAEVSHLLNGHFSRFTTDKLLDFLNRMDQKVTIQISPHKNGEPYQNVLCA